MFSNTLRVIIIVCGCVLLSITFFTLAFNDYGGGEYTLKHDQCIIKNSTLQTNEEKNSFRAYFQVYLVNKEIIVASIVNADIDGWELDNNSAKNQLNKYIINNIYKCIYPNNKLMEWNYQDINSKSSSLVYLSDTIMDIKGNFILLLFFGVIFAFFALFLLICVLTLYLLKLKRKANGFVPIQ